MVRKVGMYVCICIKYIGHIHRKVIELIIYMSVLGRSRVEENVDFSLYLF